MKYKPSPGGKYLIYVIYYVKDLLQIIIKSQVTQPRNGKMAWTEIMNDKHKTRRSAALVNQRGQIKYSLQTKLAKM